MSISKTGSDQPIRMLQYFKPLIFYFAGAIVTMLIWGWFYGQHFKISLRYPLFPTGDLADELSLTKALIHGEWWPFGGMLLRHLGAPFGPVLYSVDFPKLFPLQFLIIEIVALFSHDHFFVVNLYYLLGFVLETWAVIYAFRRFRISWEIGLCLGLLYAFLPFHFIRYGHLMLASYYLVPIAGVLLLWLWSAKPLFTSRKKTTGFWGRFDSKTWFAIIASLLIGFWHVYYAFFFMLFAGLAGINAAFYRKNIRHFWAALLLIGMVVTAIGISAVPTFYGRYKTGLNHEVAQRSVSEAEYYGLKIINLLLPLPENRFKIFRKIAKHYTSGTSLAEGMREYIGVVGIAGFLIGLLVLLFAPYRFRSSVFLKLGILLAGGCLFATMGGFSVVFSLLVTPQIRCPNRISVFLAFFGFFIIGFLLQKIKNKMKSKTAFLVLVLTLGLGGLADEITPAMKFSPPLDLANDIAFFHAVDQCPEGAVLQLPFVPFPENPPVNEMQDYSHLRAYLFSEKHSWSYGALRGRPALKKIEELSRSPLNLEALRAAGYVGIYIDRFGYPGRQFPEETRLRQLLPPPLESENKQLLFFQL
jgi:phosphoglycerol transferase